MQRTTGEEEEKQQQNNTTIQTELSTTGMHTVDSCEVWIY